MFSANCSRALLSRGVCALVACSTFSAIRARRALIHALGEQQIAEVSDAPAVGALVPDRDTNCGLRQGVVGKGEQAQVATVVAAIAYLQHLTLGAASNRDKADGKLGAFQIRDERHLSELRQCRQQDDRRRFRRVGCVRGQPVGMERARCCEQFGGHCRGARHRQRQNNRRRDNHRHDRGDRGRPDPAPLRHQTGKFRWDFWGGAVGHPLQLVEKRDLIRDAGITAGGIGDRRRSGRLELAVDIGVEGGPIRRRHLHRLCPRARAIGVTFPCSITSSKALRARARRLMTVPSATPNTSAASR